MGRLGFLIAAALVMAGAGTAAGDPLPGKLGHAGRFLTDARGRVVILHGFNLVAKSPPYTPASVGFDEDDAAFLVSANAEFVSQRNGDALLMSEFGATDNTDPLLRVAAEADRSMVSWHQAGPA